MKKRADANGVGDRTFKTLFHHLIAGDLGDYVMKRSKSLNRIGKDERKRRDFLEECYRELLQLTHERGIPVHWATILLRIVITGDMVLPLHEGISLSVGTHEYTRDPYEEQPAPDKTARQISINITSKVSQTQIIEFVKEYAPLIERLQADIDLPEIKPDKTPNLDEAYLIRILRDIQGLSWSGIVGEMKKTYPKKRTFTVDNVRKTYRNYSKILSPVPPGKNP